MADGPDGWKKEKKMTAIGIRFLYDRKLGAPEDISRNFSKYFPEITKNLVDQKFLSLPELKEIMDSKHIFWGGIKEKFDEILIDNDSIGLVAWQLYKNQTGIEAVEDIKSLIYDGSKAPWKYVLIISVLYK